MRRTKMFISEYKGKHKIQEPYLLRRKISCNDAFSHQIHQSIFSLHLYHLIREKVLEKKKLQRMHDYFKYQGHPEVNRMAPRDIAICIRLIDIFMQDDAAYNTWLDKSFSGELKWRKLDDGMYELDDSDSEPFADFPVYVNIRNEQRFFRDTPIKDAQTEGRRDYAILRITRLRQEKALHLYHLIREYKLMTWWD